MALPSTASRAIKSRSINLGRGPSVVSGQVSLIRGSRTRRGTQSSQRKARAGKVEVVRTLSKGFRVLVGFIDPETGKERQDTILKSELPAFKERIRKQTVEQQQKQAQIKEQFEALEKEASKKSEEGTLKLSEVRKLRSLGKQLRVIQTLKQQGREVTVSRQGIRATKKGKEFITPKGKVSRRLDTQVLIGKGEIIKAPGSATLRTGFSPPEAKSLIIAVKKDQEFFINGQDQTLRFEDITGLRKAIGETQQSRAIQSIAIRSPEEIQFVPRELTARQKVKQLRKGFVSEIEEFVSSPVRGIVKGQVLNPLNPAFLFTGLQKKKEAILDPDVQTATVFGVFPLLSKGVGGALLVGQGIKGGVQLIRAESFIEKGRAIPSIALGFFGGKLILKGLRKPISGFSESGIPLRGQKLRLRIKSAPFKAKGKLAVIERGGTGAVLRQRQAQLFPKDVDVLAGTKPPSASPARGGIFSGGEIIRLPHFPKRVTQLTFKRTSGRIVQTRIPPHRPSETQLKFKRTGQVFKGIRNIKAPDPRLTKIRSLVGEQDPRFKSLKTFFSRKLNKKAQVTFTKEQPGQRFRNRFDAFDEGRSTTITPPKITTTQPPAVFTGPRKSGSFKFGFLVRPQPITDEGITPVVSSPLLPSFRETLFPEQSFTFPGFATFEDTAQRVETPQRTEPRPISSFQGSRQQQEQGLILIPEPEFPAPDLPPQEPIQTPVTTALTIDVPSNSKEFKIPQKQPGFNAFVKEKGLFIKVTPKPLPKNRALNKGLSVADNTTARSVQVRRSKSIPSTVLDEKISTNINKFTQKNNNTFIERSTFAIDSPGEFRNITVKGWLARRSLGGFV